MNTPEALILINCRCQELGYGQSRRSDEDIYHSFLRARVTDGGLDVAQILATMGEEVFHHNDLVFSDSETMYFESVAKKLCRSFQMPEAILYPSGQRFDKMFQLFAQCWVGLNKCLLSTDLSIRGQDLGLMDLYDDWRMFVHLYPGQEDLAKRQGEIIYRFPQGENVPDVIHRVGHWLEDIRYRYTRKRVLVFLPTLPFFIIRMILERLSFEAFVAIMNDNESLVSYRRNDGSLELEYLD